MYKSIQDTDVAELIEDAEPIESEESDDDGIQDEAGFIREALLKLADDITGPNAPDPDASTFLEYYYGDQNQSIKSWMRDIPANIIMPLIETQVGQVTDEQQYLDVISKSAGRSLFGMFKTEVLNDILEDNNFETADEQFVRTAKIFGEGIYKAYYDTVQKRIRFNLRDPRNICFDAGACEQDFSDAERAWEWVVLSRGDFNERYPDRCDEVSTNDDAGEDVSLKAPWAENIIGVSQSRKDYIAVLEFYYKKRNYAKSGKPLGSEWRRCVFSRNIILEDKKWKYKHLPYITLQNVGNRTNPTNQIRGTSDVRILWKLQDEINRTWTQIAAIREYMVNPRVVISAYSGLYQNISDVTGGPGEVWPMESIDDVRFDSGDGPRGVLYDHIKFLRETGEMALGIYDVSQGRRAKNIVSGAAIEALQEAGRVRPRAFQRAYKRSKRQLGRVLLELINKHYTDERQIQLAGYEGARADRLIAEITGQVNDLNLAKVGVGMGIPPTEPDAIEAAFAALTPEEKAKYEIDEMPVKALGSNTGFEDKSGKQKYSFSFIGKDLFDVEDDDVRVENSTYLPTDPAQRADLYMALRKQGDMTRKGMFEALRIPNGDEILEDLEAEEQQKAEQAAQAAAGQLQQQMQAQQPQQLPMNPMQMQSEAPPAMPDAGLPIEGVMA
jgi:hypothetical protein